MIYVDRSQVAAPTILRSRSAATERARISDLLRSDERHLGQLRVKFNSTLWSRCLPELMLLFNGKCAYCETTLSGKKPIEIEHYRPKEGAEDLRNVRDHLHYSWLTLEWENMFIACVECNRRRVVNGQLVGKGELFPLESRRAQMMASVDECRRIEKPLLLDPCFDQPSEHLLFEESGRVTAASKRGEVTIEVLGLNLRKDLVLARSKIWADLREFFIDWQEKARRSPSPGMRLAESFVEDYLQGSQPYLATRRIALATLVREARERGFEFDRKILRTTDAFLAPSASTSPQFLATSRAATSERTNEIISVVSKTPPQKIADRKRLPHSAFHRIRRIEIRNFKGIESLDLDIPPGPLNEGGIPGALMLLGENATGKSTVLEAVSLALVGSRQLSYLKLRGPNLLRRDAKDGKQNLLRYPAEVRLLFEDEDASVDLRIDRSGRISGTEHRSVVLLGYGPRRFFKKRARHRTHPAERIKSMFDPLAMIADPRKWLLTCSDKHFELAVRAIRTLLLLPERAVVERAPRNRKAKTDIVFELDHGVESLAKFSEGYKAIVAMSVDIMREMLDYWADLESARGIVLVDELDTHLHPRWKMRIASRLRRAFPKVQFISSTHDPLCVRGYYDGEVQVLHRDEESRIERINDLPNVQGLSVQQLLTSEFFGLYSAEDPTLEENVARYATLAMKHGRSASETLEMETYREATSATLQLGSTDDQRILQAALTEYLLRKRSVPKAQRDRLDRETINRLIAIWESVDAGDEKRT